MNNTDGYEDKNLIGLFDYDEEGSSQFYNLKRSNNWDDLIQGDEISGYYKRRNQHEGFYGLLLPIPERLSNIVSDITEGVFTRYVEVKNLPQEDELLANNLVDETNVLGNRILKFKDNKKKTLSQVLVGIDSDQFTDFGPLFDNIEDLFGIELLDEEYVILAPFILIQCYG